MSWWEGNDDQQAHFHPAGLKPRLDHLWRCSEQPQATEARGIFEDGCPMRGSGRCASKPVLLPSELGAKLRRSCFFFSLGLSYFSPPYDGCEGEAPAGREERWDAGFGYMAWWGSAISPVLLCLVIWRRGRLKKKKLRMGGRWEAQPSPKHDIQPEEPGCAPSPPETAKTSPKTPPTRSGLMLEPTSVSATRTGRSACLRRGRGPTPSPVPGAASPFAARHLPQVTDGLPFGF